MPSRRDIDPDSDPSASTPELDAWFSAALAGARADGIADGIEMLGVGAMVIDATGCVLHLGPRARRLLSGWLSIVADHVVAARPGDERTVTALIAGIIAGRPSPSGIRLRAGVDDPVLVMRGVLVPHAGPPGGGAHAAIILDEA